MMLRPSFTEWADDDRLLISFLFFACAVYFGWKTTVIQRNCDHEFSSLQNATYGEKIFVPQIAIENVAFGPKREREPSILCLVGRN